MNCYEKVNNASTVYINVFKNVLYITSNSYCLSMFCFV